MHGTPGRWVRALAQNWMVGNSSLFIATHIPTFLPFQRNWIWNKKWADIILENGRRRKKRFLYLCPTAQLSMHIVSSTKDQAATLKTIQTRHSITTFSQKDSLRLIIELFRAWYDLAELFQKLTNLMLCPFNLQFYDFASILKDSGWLVCFLTKSLKG